MKLKIIALLLMQCLFITGCTSNWTQAFKEAANITGEFFSNLKSKPLFSKRKLSQETANSAANRSLVADCVPPQVSTVVEANEPIDYFKPFGHSTRANAPMPPQPLPTLRLSAKPAVSAKPQHTILGQPASYYAVQLFAASSQKSLNALINHYGLPNLIQARTQSSGRIWYVYLSGIYPNHYAASQAVQQLPYRLPNTPWIRQLKPLQDAIRRAKQLVIY